MSGKMSNDQTRQAAVSELQDIWESLVQSSPEVREARRGLEFHKQRVRTLLEDLDMAQLWQKELEKKCKTEEEKLQPPLLKFDHQLDQSGSVARAVLEDCVVEGNWRTLVTLLNSKVGRLEAKERPELVRLTKTVLDVRDCWSVGQPGQQELMMATQQMAGRLMGQLGQNNVQWANLEDWEAANMRQLVKEVDGVPGFVASMVDQLLADVEKGGHVTGLPTESKAESPMGSEFVQDIGV